VKIFLSAVSAQFKACRDALASDLRAIGAEVCVQEDFAQHGGTLLQKLESYIADCDRVIALVGAAYGWEPEGPARPIGFPRRSYSQWEYWFAQGERLNGERQQPLPVFLYFASESFLEEQAVPQDQECAELQQAFVNLLRQSGKDWNPFGSLHELRALVLRDGFRLGSTATQPVGDHPRQLVYLCDRQEHEGELVRLFESIRPKPGESSPGGSIPPARGANDGTVEALPRNRPVLCVIHGERHEAHMPFLERIRFHTLQRRRGLLPRGQCTWVQVPCNFRSADGVKGFGREVRNRICDKVSCLAQSCRESDEALAAGLIDTDLGLVAPFVTLPGEADPAAPREALDLIQAYWRAFPDITRGPLIACFVLARFEEPSATARTGFLSGLGRLWGRKSPAGNAGGPRAAVASWAREAGTDRQVSCRLIPELCSARRQHADEWANLEEVRAVLPSLTAFDVDRLFVESGTAVSVLPMDAMHVKLQTLIETNQRRPTL
jgi:hypothetical protein